MIRNSTAGANCDAKPNGALATRTGDHDNKKFVKTLKRDINAAIKRGSKVVIGKLLPIKASMTD